jgi:hypothetical protein
MRNTEFYRNNSATLDGLHPLIRPTDELLMSQTFQLRPPALPIFSRAVSDDQKKIFTQDAYNYWVGRRYLNRCANVLNAITIYSSRPVPIVNQWLKNLLDETKILDLNDYQYCGDVELCRILDKHQLKDQYPVNAPTIPNTNTKWTF